MNLYVGNLPFSTNDDDLRTAFEAHGTVSSAQVIMDRDTGRSRGFGFVEMDNDDEARAAIEALDGSDLAGRRIKVNEARPRN
jgi:RNA recognition motif-containing protein